MGSNTLFSIPGYGQTWGQKVIQWDRLTSTYIHHYQLRIGLQCYLLSTLVLWSTHSLTPCDDYFGTSSLSHTYDSVTYTLILSSEPLLLPQKH